MKKRIFLTICLVVCLTVLLAVAASAAGSTGSGETMRVGYARVNITPTESVPLAGYGNTSSRMSNGLLNSDYPLYTTCIAMEDAEGKIVLMFANDLSLTISWLVQNVRASITKTLEIPGDQIMITCSHTHSGPDLSNTDVASIPRYRDYLVNRMTEAAVAAVADLTEVQQMSVGSVEVEDLNFVRHYVTDTGNVVGNNHGTGNEISHVTDTDNTMFLLRFTRTDGKKDVVLANWRAHATLTGNGGDNKKISPDYIGPFRTEIEKAANCNFAYFQGASGNINPLSQLEGEGIAKEWKATNYVTHGEKLSGFAVQGLKNMKPVEVGALRTSQTVFYGDVYKGYTYRQYEGALKIQECRNNSTLPAWLRDNQINKLLKEYGIFSVYQAATIVRNYEAAYDTLALELNAISIGDAAAFVTSPNELFDSSAVELEEFVKENGLFDVTFTLCYANDSKGYLPSAYAYEYGCYEADTAHFVKGTAELVIDQFRQMLKGLHSYCECGGAAEGMPGHTCKARNWEPWKDSSTLPTGSKSIYLTKDVTLSQSWSGSVGQTLRIDLNGHTIKCNNGAAISLKDGVNLVITDSRGERTGSVVGTGRAIQVDGGSFTMWSGNVRGGLPVNGGSVTLSGGWIDGGVHVESTEKFKLAGTIKISGANANLQLAAGAIDKLDVTGLERGAYIGITMEPGTDFLKNATDVMRAAFVSDNTAYSVYRDPTTNNVRLISGHWHCVCNGSAAGVPGHTCEDVEWSVLPSAPADGGHYYLNADRTTFLSVGSASGTSQKYSLCLNGHSIDRGSANDRAIGIYTASRLDICDHKKPDGSYKGLVTSRGASSQGSVLFLHLAACELNIYGGNYVRCSDATGNLTYGGIIASEGTVRIYDGLIEGTEVTGTTGIIGGAAIYSKKLSIYGGTILGGTAPKGGAVNVANFFEMSGGVISGGTAATTGGCVNIESGTATISGGVIENGVAYGAGGGCVNLAGGTLTMTGGVIQDGVAYYNGSGANGIGGNVRVPSGTTFNFVGGVITGGKTLAGDSATRSNNGGNVAIYGGTLNMSGGKILDGYSGNAGGNLYSDGTLNISGGQILHGTSKTDGENIYNTSSASKLSFSGDAYIDGGVYVNLAHTLTVSGSPRITEKNSNTSTYGVTLRKENNQLVTILQASDLQSGASIGINMVISQTGEQFGQLVSGSEDVFQYFYYTGSRLYKAELNGNQLVFVKDEHPGMKARIGANEYETVSDALEAAKPGDVVVLMTSVYEDIKAEDGVILDLAGKTLFGNVTGGKLSAIDSTSKTSGTGEVGMIKGEINATVASATQVGDDIYVYTKEADNIHSFHKIELKVAKAYLRPVSVGNEPGLYFMSQIVADDKVYRYTDSWLDSFGAAFSKTNFEEPSLSLYGKKAYSAFGPEGFLRENKMVPGTLVGEILSRGGATTPLYCRAYIKTADGLEIFSKEVSLTLKYMIEYADKHWSTLIDSQRQAMGAMYETHGEKMIDWDLTHNTWVRRRPGDIEIPID